MLEAAPERQSEIRRERYLPRSGLLEPDLRS